MSLLVYTRLLSIQPTYAERPGMITRSAATSDSVGAMPRVPALHVA